MKTKILGLITFIVVIFSPSCTGDLSEAQYVASQFYNYLLQNRYDDIFTLLDKQMLQHDSFASWKSKLISQINQRGQLEDFRRTHIEMQKDKNDDMIVTVRYRVSYRNGDFDEAITLIKRPEEKKFKILKYEYFDKSL